MKERWREPKNTHTHKGREKEIETVPPRDRGPWGPDGGPFRPAVRSRMDATESGRDTSMQMQSTTLAPLSLSPSHARPRFRSPSRLLPTTREGRVREAEPSSVPALWGGGPSAQPNSQAARFAAGVLLSLIGLLRSRRLGLAVATRVSRSVSELPVPAVALGVVFTGK